MANLVVKALTALLALSRKVLLGAMSGPIKSGESSIAVHARFATPDLLDGLDPIC